MGGWMRVRREGSRMVCWKRRRLAHLSACGGRSPSRHISPSHAAHRSRLPAPRSAAAGAAQRLSFEMSCLRCPPPLAPDTLDRPQSAAPCPATRLPASAPSASPPAHALPLRLRPVAPRPAAWSVQTGFGVAPPPRCHPVPGRAPQQRRCAATQQQLVARKRPSLPRWPRGNGREPRGRHDGRPHARSCIRCARLRTAPHVRAMAAGAARAASCAAGCLAGLRGRAGRAAKGAYPAR
jgi:hypothetical protein